MLFKSYRALIQFVLNMQQIIEEPFRSLEKSKKILVADTRAEY